MLLPQLCEAASLAPLLDDLSLGYAVDVLYVGVGCMNLGFFEDDQSCPIGLTKLAFSWKPFESEWMGCSAPIR